jgi:3-oxoacyl-[acyl-carrier protein] reductase
MKQALITGGGGDLAQAIVATLEAANWAVCAPPRGELDVTDEDAVRSCIARQTPELLVCVAGLTRDALLARATEADWDEVFAVNFRAARSCANLAIEKMSALGGGHVIFISSFSAVEPPQGQLTYVSAKAALLGLTRDLARRHGAANLRVNAILPGFLETRMTREVRPARLKEIRDAHELGRFNTTLEVAKFIRFLHEELPHTSGQTFNLDSRQSEWL